VEKLATEFQRDPLTFCWLDLSAQPAAKQALWKTQFGRDGARKATFSFGYRSSPLWPDGCFAFLWLAFVAALSYNGKKIALLTPHSVGGRQAREDDARKWLVRLAGGEVAQSPSTPGLFA
jgi:hypothetical protein